MYFYIISNNDNIHSDGPLEYMCSHPVRPFPLYFSPCVEPSLYIFIQRAKALKRLNICAGPTKPFLFANPLIGFTGTLLVPPHKNRLAQTDQCLLLFALCQPATYNISIFKNSIKLSLVKYYFALGPNIMHELCVTKFTLKDTKLTSQPKVISDPLNFCHFPIVCMQAL